MTASMRDLLTDLDPFDLPDWLGTAEVTWTPETGVRSGHHVAGHLSEEPSSGSPAPAPAAGGPVSCDLLAVDEAYPLPVASDDVRKRAHQSWRHGQILLLSHEDRLTLAVPGTAFTADLVLDALSRLARAVGGSPDRFTARLRIGVEAPSAGR